MVYILYLQHPIGIIRVNICNILARIWKCCYTYTHLITYNTQIVTKFENLNLDSVVNNQIYEFQLLPFLPVCGPLGLCQDHQHKVCNEKYFMGLYFWKQVITVLNYVNFCIKYLVNLNCLQKGYWKQLNRGFWKKLWNHKWFKGLIWL